MTFELAVCFAQHGGTVLPSPCVPTQDTLPRAVAQWLRERALGEEADAILQRRIPALVGLRIDAVKVHGKKIEGSQRAKQRLAYAVNATLWCIETSRSGGGSRGSRRKNNK